VRQRGRRRHTRAFTEFKEIKFIAVRWSPLRVERSGPVVQPANSYAERLRSSPRRAYDLTGAFVSLIKGKHKNLPTQIGLDIFQFHFYTRAVGRFLKIFKAPGLGVSADDDLTTPFLGLRHDILRSATGNQD
jgi:hypothetical protein